MPGVLQGLAELLRSDGAQAPFLALELITKEFGAVAAEFNGPSGTVQVGSDGDQSPTRDWSSPVGNGSLSLKFSDSIPPELDSALALAIPMLKLLLEPAHNLIQEQSRALQRLAEAGSQIGITDFQERADALAEALGVRWTYIGRLIDDGEIEAFATHGLPPFHYAPAGTPCQEVIDHGYQAYPEDVHKLFPQDTWLAQLGAVAYWGAPLRDSSGRLLGIMTALNDRPLPPDREKFHRWVFDTFAARVSATLEKEDLIARISAAAGANQALAPLTRSEDIYRQATQEALTHTKALIAMLLMYSREEGSLKLVGWGGERNTDMLNKVLPAGAGLTWQVYAHDEPLLIMNAAQDPASLQITTDPADELVGFLGVPIRRPGRGGAVGVLAINFVPPSGSSTLNPADRYYLEALAGAVGAALGRVAALELAETEAATAREVASFSARLEFLAAPEDVARVALESLLRISRLEGGIFLRFEPTGVVPWIWSGQVNPELLNLYRTDLSLLQKGMLGRALEQGRGLLESNYPRYPAMLPEFARAGLGTVAVQPIYLENKAYGALLLFSSSPGAITYTETLTLMEAVGARLEHALERVLNLRELEATREQALRAMGLALEYRDLETKGHTDRVTRMVLKLGQRLGISQDELSALRWGAYLHDIGKIGIPDQVLLKPGKLLPADMVTMRTHVLIGEEMAQGLGFVPKPVLEVIRSHHEHWSGQGYPDQRAAEEIPLLARIFTLADVFDALLSSRPYKNPWPLDAAVREIEVNIGVQFDPEIAKVFLEIVRELPNP